ncbi:hypothetical protein ACH5RR_007422 [Cinchona calisaya]|uniref:NB-ARC domain-containing protein n=1 Tax=Cinchona calisaya TaxID=153742 RepID=A0ABD3AS44_9GENT
MERDQGGSSSLEQELRLTYSHVTEDHFVGLASDVELLVEHLVMENEMNYFGVVSIYGMGGLGKTTLTQKVYNHSKVKRYFDGYVWACVSQNWRKEDILQRILIGLIPERRKEILKWRDEKLVRQLFEIQQRKKYLLVLDDIWSTDAWKCMKHALPIRKDGSKILLTTRNKDVAEQIGPNGFHHQPRQLSDDESWKLLQMKALRERYERGLCPGISSEDYDTFISHLKVMFTRVVVDHLKLPKAIDKLVHLRYLSLMYSFFIYLPSSIGNLRYLQTLDLQGAKIYRIPNVLWKLRQLRHLYLPDDYSALSRKLRLKGLNKLEILENFHVPTCHTKDIFKLKNLRVLSATIHVDIADPTEIIGYFSNSNHLRRTYVTIFAKRDSAATTRISTAVAECFSCCNLHMLKIEDPVGNLPKYEAHFGASLTVLRLWHSNLMEDPMETLEMLPNLRKLYLSYDSFAGKEIRCETPLSCPTLIGIIIPGSHKFSPTSRCSALLQARTRDLWPFVPTMGTPLTN